MSDVDGEFLRLRERGDDHAARNEHAIAIECYKAAIQRRPGDRSLLFSLGYSLAATKNHHAAAIFYRKAIEAGSGAAAHNNLGLSLKAIGKQQEARKHFETATLLHPNDVLYWRNLASCLADLKDATAELGALEEVVNCHGCSAMDWNALGRARDREGDPEAALVAFRMAADARPTECVYFFNMALMHNRCGRVLDAFHACVHSLKLKPDYENALKSFPGFESKLQKLAENLAKSNAEKRPIDIGPHDYLNPYVLLRCDEVGRPSSWFEKPTKWDQMIGSVTRRRRAVVAELELSDGSIPWMRELNVTHQVVHRVVADLDDSGWHPYHWGLFQLPTLNNFLMYGDLDYFGSAGHAPYPLVACLDGAESDDWQHEEFLHFVSPFFSSRWGTAIKRSLDALDWNAVCALLATNAPVTASDLDGAIEPLRRHFERRGQRLAELEAAIENGPTADAGEEFLSAADEARVLDLIPAQFGATLKEHMCFAYRGIAIALANTRNDYEASNRALKAAEAFKVSATTSTRIAEDRAAIDDLLRRKREEKNREKRLTFTAQRKGWFSEDKLEITPERFFWNGRAFAAERIAGLRYGITHRYVNGIPSGTDALLAVLDVNGSTIDIDKISEASFRSAVDSVMGLYAPRILTKIINAARNGGSQIGQLRLSPEGIKFETGLFFKKQHLVLWDDAVTTVASGTISVFSRSAAAARTTLDVRGDWNACLLPFVVEIMQGTAN